MKKKRRKKLIRKPTPSNRLDRLIYKQECPSFSTDFGRNGEVIFFMRRDKERVNTFLASSSHGYAVLSFKEFKEGVVPFYLAILPTLREALIDFKMLYEGTGPEDIIIPEMYEEKEIPDVVEKFYATIGAFFNVEPKHVQ